MTDTSRETRLSAAFVKLADTLTDDYDVVELLNLLLVECIDLLDTSAGGLMLVGTPGGQPQLVASTSEAAEFVEINQLNAGTGPCLECITTGRPVTVGDIEQDGDRWSTFRDSATEHGFRSMHAFPLKLRDSVIGAMNLFSTTTGELTDQDIVLAQALADVATIGILQERSIRDTSLVSEQLQRALDSRVIIEQAKGVIAQSAGIDMDTAFATLRTYARNHGANLRSVAERVADRSLVVPVPEATQRSTTSGGRSAG